MSITAQANEAILEKVQQEPSSLPHEEVTDPTTWIQIITSIMREISTFCMGASSIQTAQAMKSPTSFQRWQHRRQCAKSVAEYITDPEIERITDELEDGPPEGMSRREWRDRKQSLKRRRKQLRGPLEERRDDYARRAYYGTRKTAAEQPIEKIAETVEEYRREEGMVAA